VDIHDDTVYEWDASRQTWTPQIDDDFIARYQAGYGVQYDEAAMAASAAKVVRPYNPERRSTSPDETNADVDENSVKPKSASAKNTDRPMSEKDKEAAMTDEQRKEYRKKKRAQRKLDKADKEKTKGLFGFLVAVGLK
jgi:hypothetical protein